MNDDTFKKLWEQFGFVDLSGFPTVDCDTYTPPNYTLHACSKCGIYCAEHDTHVCNQKLLELLKK